MMNNDMEKDEDEEKEREKEPTSIYVPSQQRNERDEEKEDDYGRKDEPASTYIPSQQREEVKLNQTLSRTAPADYDDVRSVKQGLTKLDLYKPDPKIGIHDYTDDAMFEGVEKFQKKNNLTVDGVMNPGGETERTMNRKLTQKHYQMNDFSSDNDWGRFNRLSKHVSKKEGGYEERPEYIDQPTNRGIIDSTLQRFKQKHPEMARDFPSNIKELTPEHTRKIYYHDYYKAYKIEKIHDETLAGTIYDFFVNHSPELPALTVQKAINRHSDERVKEDGKFGSETIDALNRATKHSETRKHINNYIVERRIEAAQGHKYEKGLVNRFRDFHID